jgi:hypothetical protein
MNPISCAPPASQPAYQPHANFTNLNTTLYERCDRNDHELLALHLFIEGFIPIHRNTVDADMGVKCLKLKMPGVSLSHLNKKIYLCARQMRAPIELCFPDSRQSDT